ncbi:MAG: hypothetical protein O3B42_02135 [Actinomycetota bacterium]|nr:hypothetical protein [Actinomycetota bacterium]
MAAHVLFVCSGNICRSPLAEYVARRAWADIDVIVSSAGTSAIPGQRATQTMITTGAELGVDLTPHRARSIDRVDQPDLVLCMEEHHVSKARDAFPGLANTHIVLLDPAGVDDPYNEPITTYRSTAAQIAAAIDAFDPSKLPI